LRTYVHLLDKGLSDADFLDGVVSASSARSDPAHPRLPS